jgi:hypothetical protein
LAGNLKSQSQTRPAKEIIPELDFKMLRKNLALALAALRQFIRVVCSGLDWDM